ncbi:MAG TPA: ATP-binding protein [Chloroflexota bacterium]|nr:ATP-binding protein [Chloroflexota bacterium]
MSTTAATQPTGSDGLQRYADYFGLIKIIAGAVPTLTAAYVSVVGRGSEQVAGVATLVMCAAIILFVAVRSKPRPIAVPEAPAIRGLAPFNEYDEQRFSRYERGTEIGTLVQKVEDDTRRVTLVEGLPSSGKTSLLRAGLLPKLAAPTWLPVYCAVTERADPLEDLRRKFTAPGSPDPGDRTLAELIERRATETQRIPVVILDQAEQLFTADAGRGYRGRLLEALRNSLDAPGSQVRLVVCISSGSGGLQVEASELQKALGRVIPPTAEVPVERFAPDRAATLLKTMADDDMTPFTSRVRSAIVGDLVRDGTVCPAELQAISQWARDARICTLAGYERVGRARGLFWRHVRRIVAPIDRATSVGPARHILNILSDAALMSPEASVSVADIVNSYGDPAHATGLLQKEALENALVRLVDDHLVRRAIDDHYQLLHSYFAKDIKEALPGEPSSLLRAWWMLRSVVVAYSLASAIALVVTAVCTGAALIALGAPGVQPRWALAGPVDDLGRDTVWAFGPNNSYLAAAVGKQLVVWDLLPDRLLAWDIPSRPPMLTVDNPPKAVDGASSYVPFSVGFLADESEAYGISLDTLTNRWQLDRIQLKDPEQLKPLDGALVPPDGPRCTPTAAAWSLKLAALAVAYSCGPVVLIPTGPDFVAIGENNTIGAEQAFGATPDETCEPGKMALTAVRRRLLVAYKCTDRSKPDVVTVHSKLVTWELGTDGTVSIVANVDFKEAEDNEIQVLMFRGDGNATAGFGTMSDLVLYDVSTDPPTRLVRNSSNRVNPGLVWVAADGRLVAVQGETAELKLEVVDMWLGPVRVPNLPFKPQPSDLMLHLG